MATREQNNKTTTGKGPTGKDMHAQSTHAKARAQRNTRAHAQIQSRHKMKQRDAKSGWQAGKADLDGRALEGEVGSKVHQRGGNAQPQHQKRDQGPKGHGTRGFFAPDEQVEDEKHSEGDAGEEDGGAEGVGLPVQQVEHLVRACGVVASQRALHEHITHKLCSQPGTGPRGWDWEWRAVDASCAREEVWCDVGVAGCLCYHEDEKHEAGGHQASSVGRRQEPEPKGTSGHTHMDGLAMLCSLCR